jgi:hypothetical protein
MRTYKPFGIASAALAATLVAATPTAVGAPPAHPSCRTAGLVIWISSAQGAAGSFFYTLEFTNQSGHTCTLRGFPGVSAVNLGDRQLGSPAAHDTTTKVKTITLRNDASATTTLRVVDVLNFPPSKCRPADAAGVRVFPPNEKASKTVPLPFKACTKKLIYMRVRAVSR